MVTERADDILEKDFKPGSIGSYVQKHLWPVGFDITNHSEFLKSDVHHWKRVLLRLVKNPNLVLETTTLMAIHEVINEGENPIMQIKNNPEQGEFVAVDQTGMFMFAGFLNSLK